MDELKGWFKKVTAPITSAIAAVLGYHFIAPLKHWYWIALFILLAVAALAIGYLFVRRLMSRGADPYDKVEAEEPRVIHELGENLPGIKQIKMLWNRSIDFLKKSYLKKWGDPLYVLPWYMMLGERGAGKTSALRGAHLVSFSKEEPDAQIRETDYCEWSFFEQAIVIDTAGRYSSALSREEDRREWMRMLDLLCKSRKKEPLNGVVVALSAERLQSQTPDALESAGQALRKRVDELMRALGAKFPVYLLVTKCDFVPGMVESFAQISENGRHQAMGALNHNLQGEAGPFVKASFFALGQRLKSLRLVLANEPGDTLDPEMLMFPEAFARLERGTAAFARGAFQENLYQETPLLRGLFFSAAPPSSHPASAGIFLNEFFAKVLPADRALFTPTKRALDWWKKTMTMGVVAWLIFAATLGGLMTYSFASNLALLRDADRQFSHLPAPKGELLSDILSMSHVNHALLSLKEDGVVRWLPSFGLHESGRVKKALQEKLSGWFWQVVLAPFDAQNAQAITRFTRTSSDEQFSQYVEHLIGRIELLHARQRGETRQPAAGRRELPVIPSLKIAGSEASNDLKAKFAELYVSSVFWLADANELNREAVSLQTQLKRLLAVKGDAPQWVIAWAKAQDTGTPLQLGDYWGSSVGGATVPAIFTRKNKALIDAFFGEIETAMGDPDSFADLKSQYEQWYRAGAFEAWHRFVADFPRGMNQHTADAWRRMAMRVGKDEGPYFTVLSSVALELEPLSNGKDTPAWLKQVYQFEALKGSQTRASFARESLQKFGVEGDKSYTVAAALKDYRDALQKMTTTALDASAASTAVAQLMQGDAAPGSSPFADTLSALAHVKNVMSSGQAIDPAVWRVISGPYDYLFEYAQRQNADQLQTMWEKKVLADAAGIPAGEVAGALLAPEGPAIRFAKETAAPFVEWKPGRGYCPKQSFGARVPFTESFFAFLNSGAKLTKASHINSANVTVTAIGAETNPEASRIPSGTRISIRCGKKTQTLANTREHLVGRAFSVETKTFAWTPTCGDATLTIDIGGIDAMHVYPGEHGFLDFVKDFAAGTHAFAAAEFPSQANALAAMGVKTMTVHYQTKGAPQDMPDFSAPSPVPLRIVWGWDR